MKILQILGIAAVTIGTSSTLAQAVTIKQPGPPININLQNVAVPALPGTPNIVNNPGFETGNFSGYFVADPSGESLIDSTMPHTGVYDAQLGTIGTLGTLSQALPTTVGTSYLLSYYLANQTSSGQDEFITRVGSTKLFDQTLPSQDYTLYSFSFVATSTTTQLQFQNENDAGFFFLDDISVVPAATVPEPSVSLGTLAFGVGIGYLLKRQRKSRNNLS